jgi:Na+/alanine symporter
VLFGVIVLSSIISPTYIWDTVDVGTALLSIINVYALFKLRKVMIEEYHSK